MDEADVVNADTLQLEIFELLNRSVGFGAEKPKCAVGLRGKDVIVFAPDGEQYVVLIEKAIAR